MFWLEVQVQAIGDEGPARAAMSRPARGFKLVAEILAALGTIWIFALMALIVADVLGRNFFDNPITGVAEIAARSVVAIVFLQISAAVLAGRMTRADFLVVFLAKRSPGLMRGLECLFALVGALVFAAIVWASWPDTADAYRTSEYFGVQGLFTIPTLPFRMINVVGAALACLAYALVAVQALTANPVPDEAAVL